MKQLPPLKIIAIVNGQIKVVPNPIYLETEKLRADPSMAKWLGDEEQILHRQQVIKTLEIPWLTEGIRKWIGDAA